MSESYNGNPNHPWSYNYKRGTDRSHQILTDLCQLDPNLITDGWSSYAGKIPCVHCGKSGAEIKHQHSRGSMCSRTVMHFLHVACLRPWQEASRVAYLQLQADEKEKDRKLKFEQNVNLFLRAFEYGPGPVPELIPRPEMSPDEWEFHVQHHRWEHWMLHLCHLRTHRERAMDAQDPDNPIALPLVQANPHQHPDPTHHSNRKEHINVTT